MRRVSRPLGARIKGKGVRFFGTLGLQKAKVGGVICRFGSLLGMERVNYRGAWPGPRAMGSEPRGELARTEGEMRRAFSRFRKG